MHKAARTTALGMALVVGALLIGVVAVRLLAPEEGQVTAPISIPTYLSESRVSHQAGFYGQLVEDRGCVELHFRGRQEMLAWPSPATHVRGDTIVLYDADIEIGDYVVITGGEFPTPTDPGEWVSPPSPQCWRDRYIIVGNIREATPQEVDRWQRAS